MWPLSAFGPPGVVLWYVSKIPPVLSYVKNGWIKESICIQKKLMLKSIKYLLENINVKSQFKRLTVWEVNQTRQKANKKRLHLLSHWFLWKRAMTAHYRPLCFPRRLIPTWKQPTSACWLQTIASPSGRLRSLCSGTAIWTVLCGCLFCILTPHCWCVGGRRVAGGKFVTLQAGAGAEAENCGKVFADGEVRHQESSSLPCREAHPASRSASGQFCSRSCIREKTTLSLFRIFLYTLINLHFLKTGFICKDV